MRNLLGRLNARSSDDLVRIARFWRISLPGADRGRHVGTIYRVMTDLRACRDAWEQFDEIDRRIVRLLAVSESGPFTIAEIAEQLEEPEDAVRDNATRLFRVGVLSVQGDNQELPVGASPRLFLPRELGQDMRRILDEVDAGDQSRTPLRTLLEGRDDPELEETATRWGIRIIPGLRRRRELIDDILQQMSGRKRIAEVVENLSPPARSLWREVRRSGEQGPVPCAEAINRAGLAVPDAPPTDAVRRGTVLRNALIELETASLVLHTYLDDGGRAFFIPREILNPGEIATAAPLPQLQPVEEDDIPAAESFHPFALAWDLLTIVREVISRGAPVWVPGESLSLTWQRQLNRRLWFGRDDIPPDGYLGMLFYLGLGVGVLEPGPRPQGAGADKHAVRPVPSSTVRQWRSRDFADQTAAMRDIWLSADQWIEGREREQIDVWGADWQGFRRRLLGALRDIGSEHWYFMRDVARKIANDEPGMIGPTFTAASARGGRDDGDGRAGVIAQIIEIEIETALWWFGFVELSRVGRRGIAMRVTEAAQRAARDSRAAPPVDEIPADIPDLTVSDTGLITLNRPAPVHVWSLSAFADAEQLRPTVTYQLRPGSVGRALGAGFDIDQITGYLERQGRQPLPDEVVRLLREWTAGYKRVRMRRAAVLTPDVETSVEQLRDVLAEAGLEVVEAGEGRVIVLLPATGEDAAASEDALQSALRAAGYTGQWTTDLRT